MPLKNIFLLLTDAPQFILVDDEVYYLHYSDSFADDVLMIPHNEPFYSLTSALNKIFSHLNYHHSNIASNVNTRY